MAGRRAWRFGVASTTASLSAAKQVGARRAMRAAVAGKKLDESPVARGEGGGKRPGVVKRRAVPGGDDADAA